MMSHLEGVIDLDIKTHPEGIMERWPGYEDQLKGVVIWYNMTHLEGGVDLGMITHLK